MAVRVSLTDRLSIESRGVLLDEQRFGRQGRLAFAYLLAAQGRPVPRDELADALWGDEPPARWEKALSVLVSKLRALLNECVVDGTASLTSAFGCYQLTLPAGSWIDVAAAETAAAAAERARAAGDLDGARTNASMAESLARRTFLPGEDGSWVAERRAELREILVRALDCLAEASRLSGDMAAAVRAAEELITLEPFRERGYRLLMQAHSAAGNDAEALRRYERCRVLLAEELGAYPSAETEAVYLDILRSSRKGSPAEVAAAEVELGSPNVRRAPRRLVLGAAVALATVAGAVVAAVLLWSSPEREIVANGISSLELRSGVSRGGATLATGLGAVAYGAGAVWTIAPDEGRVLRIDRSTRAVVDRIDVGLDPEALTVCGGAVWVANAASGTVAWIDPETSSVVRTVRVGNGPSSIACGSGHVWVANRFDNAVVGIDVRTGRVMQPVRVGAAPTAVAFGLGSLWVAAESSSFLLRIDPTRNRVVDHVEVGPGIDAIAAGTEELWIANGSAGTVSHIDPDRGVSVATISVAEGAGTLALAGDAVWFADGLRNRITRIDATEPQVAKVLTTAGTPGGLAVGDGRLWVATGGPAAEKGGTLRVVTSKELIEPPDPALAAGPLEIQLLAMTNDGLVGFKRVGGVVGETLVPDLAVALPTPTDGGRTYVFRLYQGVRYSTGVPVRATDVRRGLERALRLEPFLGLRRDYGAISGAATCSQRACNLDRGIVADDKARTVTFHLTAPDPRFIAKLAQPFADPVPAGVPDPARSTRPGPDWRPVVPATGPYMVDSFAPDRLRLVRNPYFRVWSSTARPDGYADTIDWRIAVAAATAFDAVRRNRADLVDGPQPLPRLDELQTRFAAQLHVFPQARTHLAFLNASRPPFNDPRVRRALAYAIDRDRVVRLLGGPLGASTTCQLIPNGADGYSPYCPYTQVPSASGAWGGPDLDRARRLVAASGTAGKEVLVWTFPLYAEAGRYLTGVLNDLGYRATLDVVPLGRFFRTWQDSRDPWQVAVLNWVGTYGTARDALGDFRCETYVPHSGANVNPSRFCDRRVDRAITKAERLERSDRPAALAAWARAERLLVDSAPFVALANLHTLGLASRHVTNVQYHPAIGVLLDQVRPG